MQHVRSRSPFLVLPAAVLALAGATDACAVDLTVGSVEFTQIIQPLNGSVPLVRDRETWVRVVVGTDTPVDDVDVWLVRDPGGLERVYTGNVLPGPKSIVPPDSIDYGTFTHTFDFCIVLDEIVEAFEIRVDPNDLVAEDNEANNSETRVILTICRDEPRMAAVPIQSLGFTCDLEAIGVGSGEMYVRAGLPVPDLTYYLLPEVDFNADLDATDPPTDLLTAHLVLHLALHSVGIRPTHLYGWVPYALSYNGTGRFDQRVAIGTATEVERYMRTYMHELGHNTGICHVGSPDCPSYATVVSFDEETGAVGVDPLEYLDRGILQADTLFDVMRAGAQTANAWIAPEELDHWATHPWFSCSSSGTVLDDVLVLAGSTIPGSTTVAHVIALDDDIRSDDVTTGPFRVRTLHTGVTIDVVTFEPTADPHVDPDVRGFLVSVVRRDGATVADEVRIERVSDGAVVWSSTVSAAPVVEVTSPAPGAAVAGGDLITWTMSDPDGDDLEAVVQWSWDDGTSWIPLGLIGPETSLEFPDVNAPGAGAGEGRIRVLVSDGFTTVDAEVNDLTYATDESPEVTILAPGAATSTSEGAVVHLAASVFDRETMASVPEASITWTSSVDGAIGTGRRISRDDLSPGAHVLTVEATDEDGNLGTDSIALVVESTGPAGPPCDIPLLLSEVRLAAPAPDPQDDEFIELRGPVGFALDGLCLVVLDQGGIVEVSVDLDGEVIPADGHWLCGPVSPLPASGAVPDLVATLGIGDLGNRTVLLVCTGAPPPLGFDIDADDDGMPEVTPWGGVVDAVAAITSPGAPAYAARRRGPSPSGLGPAALRRCPPADFWLISPGPVPGADTPGAPNPICPPSTTPEVVFGSTIAPVGGAGLIVAPDDAVLVTGLAPGGADGAMIELGAADFACLTLDPARLFAEAPGSAVELRAVTMDESVTTSLLVSRKPGTALGVTAMYPGVSEVQALVIDDGVVVGTFAATGSIETTFDFIDLAPGGLPPIVLEYRLKPDELPEGVRGATISLGADATVSVDSGFGSVVGDMILFRPSAPMPQAQLDRVELVGQGMSAVELSGVAIGAFGAPFEAGRGTTMSVGPQVTLDAPVPPYPGVAVNIGPVPAPRVALALNLPDPGDLAPQQGVEFGPDFRLGPGPGLPRLTLDILANSLPVPVYDLYLVTEDLPNGGHWVKIYQGLLLVGRHIFPPLDAMFARLPEAPASIGSGLAVDDVGNDSVDVVLEWAETIEILVADGQGGFTPAFGDRLEITLREPGIPITASGRLRLATRGIEQLDIATLALEVPMACPTDLDGDGNTGFADLLQVLAEWGPCADCWDCPADVDGDCSVGFNDLLAILASWGDC